MTFFSIGFPVSHTVEQVKRDLFRQASSLASLSKDSYIFGISAVRADLLTESDVSPTFRSELVQDEILTNESALFVYSNDAITRALSTNSLGQFVVELFPKSVVHQRHRSVGTDVPVSNLLKLTQLAKSAPSSSLTVVCVRA